MSESIVCTLGEECNTQRHHSWTLVPSSTSSFLLSQLPGDSTPPAADAHYSNFQQSCPDQHLCFGTTSLLPISPTSTLILLLPSHTSLPIPDDSNCPILPSFIVPTAQVSSCFLPDPSFFPGSHHPAQFQPLSRSTRSWF